MLYLLGQLDAQLSVLNIFRYITFRAAGATVTAFTFTFLFGPAILGVSTTSAARSPMRLIKAFTRIESAVRRRIVDLVQEIVADDGE